VTRFELAKELILKEFERQKDKLTIVPVEDPGTTGNFEIRVDGILVHSKRTKKHGFLHNDAKQQVLVLDYIQIRLDELP
jgi:predicted Rdx family selenoprotein